MLLVPVDDVIQESECTLAEDAKTIVNWVEWEVTSLNGSADELWWELLFYPVYEALELLVNEALTLSAQVASWEDLANIIQSLLNKFL